MGRNLLFSFCLFMAWFATLSQTDRPPSADLSAQGTRRDSSKPLTDSERPANVCGTNGFTAVRTKTQLERRTTIGSCRVPTGLACEGHCEGAMIG